MTDTPAGYRRPKKTYRLVFEDPDMAGLVVRVRSVPLGGFLDLVFLADVAERMLTAGGLGADDLGRIRGLFAGFASALVEWNLEDDDGKPVTPDLDGVLAQEPDLILSICVAWIQAVVGVRRPLERPSSDGAPPEEAQIPMEVSSPSPPS